MLVFQPYSTFSSANTEILRLDDRFKADCSVRSFFLKLLLFKDTEKEKVYTINSRVKEFRSELSFHSFSFEFANSYTQLDILSVKCS